MSNEEKNNPDLIVWTFDFALTTFFEIETEIIEALLPERIVPMEVAPGISLINITAFNFMEGGLGHMPEFQELIFSTVVAPDLSRGVPKFAMFILSLGSSCTEHLDHSFDYYKLPSHYPTLEGQINKSKVEVSYRDESGPILNLQNCASQLNFEEQERYFQAFAERDGDLYVADIYIRAQLYEHQVKSEAGELYHHAFLKNVDVEGIEPVAYLQMITKPGHPGKQFYYRPEKY